MKAVKPRAKSKKSNARFARVKFSNNKGESGENGNGGGVSGPDLSELRKPIDISVSSLLEVTKLLEIGGEEVKSMLSYECDVVYECRICRSLFRSLANFISHKRVYCREKFNVAHFRKTRNKHIISAETLIPNPQEFSEDNNHFKEDDNNIRILRSQVVKNSFKKDLTSVVDMLQKKRSEDMSENLLSRNLKVGRSSCKVMKEGELVIDGDKSGQKILLEEIDSTKTAVYQTATAPTVCNTDPMKAQIVELQNMEDRSTAILSPEGNSIDANQLEKSDSPLQIYGSDGEEEEGANGSINCPQDLVCTVCNAKFATRKTLTYHMKSLHVSYRTCYPCPCCNSTFANSWSVYRHLFKIHRKSNEQVRKLRTQIQEKAFRKETTGAEDIEKENSAIKSSGSSEQQTSNNTQQEWMEHFELDLELQRCGGCGRRFDRRAALISHSQLCVKRIAACNEASGNKSKRLSKTPSPKNVVEENNSGAKEAANRVVSTRAQTSKKKIPQKSKITQVREKSPTIDTSSPDVSEGEAVLLPQVINNSELSIRVENVSRISNADWEMMGRNSSNDTLSPNSDISLFEKDHQTPFVANDHSLLMNVPDSPEIIFTSIDKSRTVAISFGAKKRRVSLINNSKELNNGSSSSSSSSGSVPAEGENSFKTSPVNKEIELMKTSHMTMMENRIATIANLRKLQCLPCRRKFTSMTNLRRHMAVHIGWHRYKCKLCDFKCFVKCDCVAHCNKFHDAKNNRSIIADMVIQIPPEQSTLAQEIMMDLSSSYPANSNSEPELIDVTESSPKSIEADNSNGGETKREELNKENAESKDLETSGNEKADDLKREERSKSEEKGDENPKKNGIEEISEQAQGRLDKDPDLRKMVMEVIFGTGESSGVGGGSVRDHPDVRDARNSEEKTTEAEESPIKVSTNGGKESGGNKLEEALIKRQRPTRNRVKPVNEDFIYDLTELIRKESANHRAAATAAQKTLKKRQLIQQQQQQQQQLAIAENDANNEEMKSNEASNNDGGSNEAQRLSNSSYKLPNILSHHKKGESNGLHNSGNKLPNLKQAEIRLVNASNGIISGKNISSTKISVSNQK